MPSVAIGLPVYNGELYLRSALESLLAQDYPDFTITICDNASTDGTQDIAREFAHSDRRVSYHRQPKNCGAADNFNEVFKISDQAAEFFTWAGHDDLWEPSYISACLGALRAHPALVSCSSAIEFMDDEGKPVDVPRVSRDTSGLSLRARVARLTVQMGWFEIYAVTRRAALRQTRLYRNTFGGDVILSMELALQGGTKVLPEKLFRYRYAEKPAEQYFKDITGASSQNATPYTDLARSLVGVINDAKCSPWLKRRMRRDLIKNIFAPGAPWAELIFAENHARGFPAKRLVDSKHFEFGGVFNQHVTWRLMRSF